MKKYLALLLVCLLVPHTASAALTDNLVSFWELGEASGTRNDSHSTNHLTDNNTVAQAAGKVGNAADFEADNTEYLSHASNAALQMGDIDFTICAWVNPESLSSTMSVVSKDDDAASSRDYTFDISSSVARFYINGGGANEVDSTTTLSTATWYFICVWHDAAANTVNVQVNDGTAESASTGGTVPDTSAAEFRIGAREYAANENYFDGLIDQVGIWKRTLTAGERTTLYNGGAGISYATLSGGGAATALRGTLLGVGP